MAISSPAPKAPHTADQPSGLPQAITAYLVWGLFPIYLMRIKHLTPLEFVGWRILFTAPVCILIVIFRRQVIDVLNTFRNRKVMLLLLGSSILIGGNWLIYVMAIHGGHVFAASLGYYINPLVNVLAGTLFLGEKMTRTQWFAVILAAAGVSLLAWGATDMLGISLALAGTFCAYGLVRKLAPVGSLPGLTIETILLLLPAAVILYWQAHQPGGLHFGHDTTQDLLTASSGIITSIPLLLFAVAARRMDYSTLGFIQFLAPTIVFFLGLFMFHEPLKTTQLACFILIWVAIAIFVWDVIRRRKTLPATNS